MDITLIASVVHEANRAYCHAIGDDSQPSWEDAPTWQRDSAIQGIQAIIDNPDTTPEQSHEGWLDVKRADGWSFGEVKDPVRKVHPCFIPYAQLPENQRVKDELFGAIVRALL